MYRMFYDDDDNIVSSTYYTRSMRLVTVWNEPAALGCIVRSPGGATATHQERRQRDMGQ